MSGTDTRQREAERYPQITRAFQRTAWAVQLETYGTLVEIVSRRAHGETLTAEEIQARVGGRPARRDFQMAGTVAILPVYGVLIPRADVFTEMSGGTSVQRLQAAFRDAVEDENVTAIVLDVESPGGSSDLIPEFANDIRSARGTKPIVAVANTRAASAAYWLASQAEELVVTKSGDVGSIGTFAAHQDISKQLEMEGVTVTLVASSKEKVEASPFQPLSEEAQAEIQRHVDYVQGMFESDVAKGRGVSVETVRSSFGRGRMFRATEAVKLGMADRVDTLEATVQRLSRRRAHAPAPPPPPAPEDLLDDDGDPGASAELADVTTFADARRAAIVAADAVVNRTRAILAAPDGRLSAATRDQLHADRAAFVAAAGALGELLASTEPQSEPDDLLELEYAFAGHRDRLRR